ncbi:MAG: VWA domain-containing protein [Hamadaea sp.]|uniref:Calx-beta domain-containing protein n=1 Tax=Hamadaea sp. TaxID=2024425 RepID=UPI0017F3ECAC|nr:Calx-beta domain-containing protein [Hamadaea sp.]NUR73239.1 VWA domain-containing protein [Hamadaea sp.]NUT20242.1 VWA domain-containing protein [Hamadaea sp.]
MFLTDRRRSGRLRTGVTLVALATFASGLTFAASPAAATDPGVEPAYVNLTLPPGGSAEIAKTVHTPTVPPKPDIVFLADTTGSMGAAIGDVRSNAAGVLSTISSAQPTAQFGVAEYKDFNCDAVPFKVDQAITADPAAVQAGINLWSAGGGCDLPEADLNGLYELSTGAVTFRPDGTRIIVIFGDAPSHDPSNGHTLADTISALQAANVRVVAVNVGNLDASGQFTDIVNATGGVLLNNVPSDQVSEAILAGIQAIKVTVTPTPFGCGPPLSLSFNPTSQVVTSGDDAHFTETVNVAANAVAGTHYCEVDFLIDGTSRGYVQKLTVVVPGLSINDVSVDENAGNATFTVSLSAPAPFPVSANFATSNGTATAPADYAATNGVVSFAAGETSKQITVPIVDDAVDENNETFTVTLSSPSGAALTDPTGVGTIVDSDRNGVFSCSATALNLAGLKAGKANPADLPCVDDSGTVASVNLTSGLVNVDAKVITAGTDLSPDNQNIVPVLGDKALSTAKIESTKITVGGLVTIELGVIQSSASVTCTSGPSGLVPTFAGSSSIASLKINGVAVTVGSAPLTIPLVVGSLKLNGTTTTGTRVTQQAVVLDTLLTDVVLAESTADIHGTALHPSGNPCVA